MSSAENSRKQARRWPKGQEERREKSEKLAADTIRLLDRAREEIERNHVLAKLMIADARANAVDIHYHMKHAKQGVD